MSIKRTARIAASAVMGAGSLFMVIAPGVASASTPGCTTGVYSGYCGTQVSEQATPLAWDVYQQRATYGNKIIAYPNSDIDPATDFYWFAYQGGTTKIAEYAPSGVASNLCVSEPDAGAGLVLRVCNGSKWQQFTASPSGSGFTWTDKATGDIVAAGTIAGSKQLAGVTPPVAPATATSAEQWTFTG